MSFINAIGTAVPENCFPQMQIAEFMASALQMNEYEQRRLKALYRDRPGPDSPRSDNAAPRNCRLRAVTQRLFAESTVQQRHSALCVKHCAAAE